MTKLGLVDLEIIHLGISKKGTFDETDLAGSNLKRLGVGRMLDSLASLKDRKMLEMNSDGSFSVTDLARHILWDKEIPTKVRILRLLEIKPSRTEDISEILGEPSEDVFAEIEEMRKDQLVLMSPLREKDRLVKMYEILPEGIEAVKKIENGSIQTTSIGKRGTGTEVLELIDEIIADVKESGSVNMDAIIGKLNHLREKTIS